MRSMMVAGLLGLALLAVGGCATDQAAAASPCPPCECAPCEAAKCPESGGGEEAREPYTAKADTLPTDRWVRMELAAFSEDGEKVAVRVTDELAGTAFRVYEVDDVKLVGEVPFGATDEEAAWKRARRKYHLRDGPPGTQRAPEGELVVMGADEPKWATVLIMKGERAVKYLRIPRLTGDDDEPAKARFKHLAFTPDGKFVVAIHEQSMTRDGRPWKGDFLHTVKVREFRLPF